MNLNDILNGTIATIVGGIALTLINPIFNFLKKKIKNSFELVWDITCFIFNLLGSFGFFYLAIIQNDLSLKIIYIFFFILNLFFVIMDFYSATKTSYGTK